MQATLSLLFRRAFVVVLRAVQTEKSTAGVFDGARTAVERINLKAPDLIQWVSIIHSVIHCIATVRRSLITRQPYVLTM